MALSKLAMGMVTTIVVMYVGLFMIQKVSDLIAINNTSTFYAVYTALNSNTATIYDVLILVIVIVALAVAIHTLRGMSAPGGPSTVSTV